MTNTTIERGNKYGVKTKNRNEGFINNELDFSEWLKKAVKAQGMSVSSFCRTNDLSQHSFHNKIHGKNFTDADVMKISELLGDYSFIAMMIDHLNTVYNKKLG